MPVASAFAVDLSAVTHLKDAAGDWQNHLKTLQDQCFNNHDQAACNAVSSEMTQVSSLVNGLGEMASNMPGAQENCMPIYALAAAEFLPVRRRAACSAKRLCDFL